MLIEITKRDLWLQKVEAAIGAITKLRADEDAEFLRKWRKRFFFRKDTDFPNEYWEDNYPSSSYWLSFCQATNLRSALLSDGTGTISIDEQTLLSIEKWSKR